MKFNHPSNHKEQEDDYFSEDEFGQESNDEKDKNDENENEDENDEKQEKKPIKIRTVVRKPQPRLDSTRLCGERGLKCLMEHFENFKSKGDGHEFKDLDIMMSKYEYWAHRLFPKMKFIDVVERLEKLGEKREVKQLLHKIRLGDTEQDLALNNDIDHAIEDEQITARVMNMMNKIQDSEDDDDDENLNAFLNTYNSSSGIDSTSKNKVIDEEEENEDEIFNRLISSSNI